MRWPEQMTTGDTTTIGLDVLHRQKVAKEPIEIATVRDTGHPATVAEAKAGVQGETGRLTMEDYPAGR